MKNKERGFLLVLVNITISLFAVEYYDQYSLALSCEPISFQESFEIMDVIFLGNVISKQYLSSSQNVNVTFSVEEGFKNISEETVFIIVNDEEIWGPVFNKEMQYIVFAYYNDDEDLTIPFCSNTRSFDPSLIKELRFLTSQGVPSWIKNNAGWWAEGQIDDTAFLQGIQFLIKEGIMIIPPTESSGTSESQGVPSWIKNNAGWWAEGQIDDTTFLQGIQFLVKNSIIIIE